jgi:uncharacterized protein (TIGR02145 family)
MVVETSDATDMGGDTGTLQGKVLHDGGSNLVATGFKWGLQADLSGAADTVVTMAADSTFSAVLTGLTAGSTYYFSAYSTNAGGTVHGDTLSFIALCDAVPSEVQGCDAGALTSLNYQGYDYRLVEINGLCWFAENLRSENYNDGTTAITSGLNNSQWQQTTEGAVTIYGAGGAEEDFNLAQYGRLYNFHAVNSGNLCPAGWHVPSDGEFTNLMHVLGGELVAGGKMKSSSCWNGSNESGFSALPGGNRDPSGTFSDGGDRGWFWTSTPNSNANFAESRGLEGSTSTIIAPSNTVTFGRSVRCIQDGGTPTVTCGCSVAGVTDEGFCTSSFYNGTWSCQ